MLRCESCSCCCRLLAHRDVARLVKYCFKYMTSEGSQLLGVLVQHCPSSWRDFAKIAVFGLQQCSEHARHPFHLTISVLCLLRMC